MKDMLRKISDSVHTAAARRLLTVGATALLLLIPTGILLYFILGPGEGYLHSDCTDTLWWANASYESGQWISDNFAYAALLPFGGSLLMLPFIPLFGVSVATHNAGMILFVILFVAAAMLLCILIAVLIRIFFSSRTVRMTLTPIEVEVGEPIYYADSTRRANSWLWEFGNGDVSHERNGQYVFKEPGRYQVRLQVDHSLEKKQIITVRKKTNTYGSDQLVKMKVPASAFQGEIVSFKGYGPSKEWRWQFGESGIVDSREQNPLYAYSEPGEYEVLLTTEDTQYPVRHTIKILSQYTENDSTDVLVIIGNDIREHLQAIVDGRPFNTHYNYILKKYLCGNPDIAVTVNNHKKNDFYSYCQGLKIIARKKTVIDEVFVDMGDDLNNECVMQLMVTQHERFSESKK